MDFLFAFSWPFDVESLMACGNGLLLVSVQATLILGLAFGVTALMKRSSAAQRHLVWFMALCGLLLIPWLNVLVPHRLVSSAPISPTSPQRILAPQETFASAYSVSTTGDLASSASLSIVNSESQNLEILRTQLQWKWPIILVILWLVGVMVCSIRLAKGLWQLRRVARESSSFRSSDWLDPDDIRRQLLIHRHVAIRSAAPNHLEAVPLTWGWRKPVILLPVGAQGWGPMKQRAVLLHEMGHIARHDWAILGLAQLICILYWFHPLVWLASCLLRAESEKATDDLVLAAGVRASEYVTCLMEFTQAAKARLLPVSIGMAQASTLKSRLLALLEPGRNRRRPTRLQMGCVLGATTLFLLSLAHFSGTDEALAVEQETAPKVHVKGLVVDAQQRPVAGAKVTLYNETSGNVWGLTKAQFTTQTDERGGFQVPLPDDSNSYRSLQIEKAGFGVKAGFISSRDALKSQRWVLSAPTSLTGTVTDENGNPLRDIRVAAHSLIEGGFYSPVRGLETRTNLEGKWTISRLPVGAGADIDVVSPQYAGKRFNVFLEAKPASFPAVKLQRGFEATGSVLDIQGNPVAHAWVSLRNSGLVSAESDENGDFVLPGLTPIAQELAVQSPLSSQFGPTGIQVSSTQPRAIIRLQRGFTLQGRVLNAETHEPVAGVQIEDQMRRSGKPTRSDAAGRFEITLASAENASLILQSSTFQNPVVFVTPDQLARHNIGDILLKPATIWRGKVLVAGKAPGKSVILNLQGPGSNAQLVSDEAGNFRINSLPPGQYRWGSDLWTWKPVAPSVISIPASAKVPFVQNVEVQRIQTVGARGRVVNAVGHPLAYARVTLRSGANSFVAISRSDGHWELKSIIPTGRISIEQVEFGEVTLHNPPARPQEKNGQWTFSDLVVNDRANQVRVKVVNAQRKIVVGARVLWLWGRESRFGFTGTDGTAAFQLAPQKIRIMAAKDLTYGEVTLERSLQEAVIVLKAPQNSLSKAQAVVARLIEKIDETPNAEMLGYKRWRAIALRADGVSTNWNRAGNNFGRYLSAFTSGDPATALKQAPNWLEKITTPESARPFFLRLAEAEFALRAARSKDAVAKKWANGWMDRQLANFNAPVKLNSRWAGGDVVSRYLQGYAVATALHRPEALRFFNASLNALPRDQANPGSYSFPDYFLLDDPNAVTFRNALLPEDQVNFQGALSSSAVRLNYADASKASAALEDVLEATSSSDIKLETKRFARQRVASEILLLQIRTEPPRQAFNKLKAFDTSNYYLGTFGVSLVRRALKAGDKELGREILQFCSAKGWDKLEIYPNDWLELKAKVNSPVSKSQIQIWREQAIAHLINGDPMEGNRVPNPATDAQKLRFYDPALGRLILEAKWSKLQPLSHGPALDNRYEASSLASALGDYNPARALTWFDQIPRGGNFDPQGDELTLAIKLIGRARLMSPVQIN